MKLTNTTGLPEPIVNAVRETEYVPSGADISVTALISPIRQVALTSGHRGEMVEDAADRIFALMGKIGHGILEASGYEIFTEERLEMKIGDYTLSGAMDGLYLEKANGGWGIDDYKFTSAYVAKSHGQKGQRSRIEDWFLQLNLYRMLAEEHGFNITRLRTVLLLRDWSILAAKRDHDFPQKQVVVFEAPLMDLDNLRSWTFRQIERHMTAQQGLDQYGQSHLPTCTDDERWSKPDSYAVMKEGRKSALRVLATEAGAIAWTHQNNHTDETGNRKTGISITHRPGEDVRCENYCAVSEWCEQAKELGH